MALEESSRYWALRDVLKVMRFTVAQGATQAIGRFGVIVCLLVLPSPFGPRSNKRSSRAHLAPFTTIIVAILFALGLASLTLSIYLSFALSTPLRILSITQPSFLFTTLLLTLATFALLFALFNFAAAISRPDQNRGSFAEDFLASKATQHSVRPSLTATSPLLASSVVFTTRLPSSGSLLESSPSRSWVWSEPVSNLTLANRRLDRDMLDVVHIGLSIGRAICEVAWVGRVVQIFYGLCQPRPKAQRTHTTEADEDPNSNPHLPPSSSGHHLLHARPPEPITPLYLPCLANRITVTTLHLPFCPPLQLRPHPPSLPNPPSTMESRLVQRRAGARAATLIIMSP